MQSACVAFFTFSVNELIFPFIHAMMLLIEMRRGANWSSLQSHSMVLFIIRKMNWDKICIVILNGWKVEWDLLHKFKWQKTYHVDQNCKFIKKTIGYQTPYLSSRKTIMCKKFCTLSVWDMLRALLTRWLFFHTRRYLVIASLMSYIPFIFMLFCSSCIERFPFCSIIEIFSSAYFMASFSLTVKK